MSFINFKAMSRNYLFIAVAAAIAFATVYNAQFWMHVNQIYTDSDNLSLLFKLLTPVAISSLVAIAFITLFSYRYVLKPALIILCLVNSMVTFAAVNYGVIFDTDMIANIFQTNISEASSYFSLSAVLYFIFLGLLPAIVIYRLKINYGQSVLKNMALRIGTLAVLSVLALSIVLPNYQLYSFIGRNNKILIKEIQPFSYIIASTKYVKNTYFPQKMEYVSLGDDARVLSSSDRPKLMFFVVGETARAQNFGSLGYERNTNVYTQKEHVISFADVKSCATATAKSVPCMFSDLKRESFDDVQAQYRDNLLDVIKKAGIDVTWYENDGGCKGVCKNIKTIEIQADESRELCTNGTCKDEVFLKYAQDITQNVHKDTVVVFHLIGSHGPKYYERYPKSFKKFTPDCNRADVENCSLEEVKNAYDNTVLYTDYVLYSLIHEVLEKNMDKYDPLLLYISDHGESLGENGLFLHGTPYMIAPEYQTTIPMQIWMPQQTASDLSLDVKCLRENTAGRDLSHDNLFHTVLGLLQVQTEVYNSDLDVMKMCRG